MATIKEIAQVAGVSRGTVDRVLNNRGLVNPETEMRVRQVAKALNYVPSRAGKALAIKKRRLKIAFLLFENAKDNPFFLDVISGINAKAEELGDLGVSVEIMYSSFGNPAAQEKLMDYAVKQGFDGIALTPLNNPVIADKIRKITQKSIPVVTVNTDLPGSGRLAYVGSDYFKGGRTAANLMCLITGGKGKIGIVTGSHDVLCHSQRIDGFKDYLYQHAPGLEIVKTVQNNDDEFESFEVTRQLLKENPGIDALFLAAAGVQGAGKALQEYADNRNIKVVCFDTVPATQELMQGGVIAAAIGQQPEKQGAKPLDILVEYLSYGEVSQQNDCICATEIYVCENLPEG